jgi:hypothetical protein
MSMDFWNTQLTRSRRKRRPRGKGGAPGFTLIEAALTTVIVGTGVLAIVAAQQAYHQKNDWAAKSGTAMLLANEVRELSLTLPMQDPLSPEDWAGAEVGEGGFDDTNELIPPGDPGFVVRYNLNDLEDFVFNVSGNISSIDFSPPINARQQVLGREDGVVMQNGEENNPWLNWTQRVMIENVDEGDLGGFAYTLGSTNMLRITVTMLYQKPGATAPIPLTTLRWIITE